MGSGYGYPGSSFYAILCSMQFSAGPTLAVKIGVAYENRGIVWRVKKVVGIWLKKFQNWLEYGQKNFKKSCKDSV